MSDKTEHITEETHESYGLISVSRISGTAPLFQTSVDVGSFVEIRVAKAMVRRNNNKDWLLDRERLISIRMSANQFAEFITSMGNGVGTPCTVHSLCGKRMEEPKTIDRRKQIEDDFQKHTETIFKATADIARQARVVLDGGLKTKKDRIALSNLMSQLVMETTANLPFVHASFNEAMDKTVTEAKAEVESFVETKIRSLGLAGMESELAKLLAAPTKSSVLNLEAKEID